ncbi:hypothetical protein D0T57_14090 [Dysgonomonas sp. 511]|nr:hypothetical protein [Dysgonomonas sp. 511]
MNISIALKLKKIQYYCLEATMELNQVHFLKQLIFLHGLKRNIKKIGIIQSLKIDDLSGKCPINCVSVFSSIK